MSGYGHGSILIQRSKDSSAAIFGNFYFQSVLSIDGKEMHT